MLRLKKLELDDGEEFFEMLKGIKRNENEFTNPVYDMNNEMIEELMDN